jgi:hypothetical protein
MPSSSSGKPSRDEQGRHRPHRTDHREYIIALELVDKGLVGTPLHYS